MRDGEHRPLLGPVRTDPLYESEILGTFGYSEYSSDTMPAPRAATGGIWGWNESELRGNKVWGGRRES